MPHVSDTHFQVPSISLIMVYIKRMVLEGFRSYRDKTTVHFDQSYNVIVGLNGHGKSNLLYAVDFVCASGNHKLSDSTKILHHGGSNRATVSRVDMILGLRDNEEDVQRGVCFNGADECAFSRRMSLKKDEYLVNDKIVSTENFRSRLQSLGFTNFVSPYYIVRQGRVGEISRQSDQQRYRLLAEAAGVTDYENKKKDACKELAETKLRAAGVKSVMTDIYEQLQKMEAESDAIRQFMEISEKLTFCNEQIQVQSCQQKERELSVCLATIGALDAKIATERELIESNRSSITENEAKINDVLEDRIAMLTVEKSDLLKEQSRLDLLSRKLEAEVEQLSKEMDETKDTITSVNTAINDKKHEFDGIMKRRETYQPKLSTLDDEIRQLKENWKLKELELEDLNSRKDPKNVKYNTIQERNQDLTAKLDLHEGELKIVNDTIAGKSQEIETLKNSKDSIVKKITDLDVSLENTDAHAAELQAAAENERNLDQEIKVQKKLINDAQRDLQNVHSQANSKANALGWTNPKRLGMEAMVECSAKLGLRTSVFGSLLEVIRVKSVPGTDLKPYAAFDIAGDSNLDNYLVADSGVMTRLKCALDDFNRSNRQGGRVMFAPLKEIDERQKRYPVAIKRTPAGTHRLVDLLEFDPMFEPAVNQTFGRFLLVKDIEDGHRHNNLGWDCVTINGEIVDTRGVAKGGSVFKRCEKADRYLENINSLSSLQNKLHEGEATLKRLSEMFDVQAQMKKTLIDKRVISYQHNDSIELEKKKYTRDLERVDEAMEALAGERRLLSNEIKKHDSIIIQYRKQILNPELKFSKDDNERMLGLEKEVKKIRKLIEEQTMKREELLKLKEIDDDQVEIIQNELEGYENEKQFITESANRSLYSDHSSKHEARAHELEITSNEYEAVKASVQSAGERLAACLTEKGRAETLIASCIEQQSNHELAVNDLLIQHETAQKNKESLEVDTNELKSLVELNSHKKVKANVQGYRSMTIPALKREVVQLKDQLNEIGEVNLEIVDELTKWKSEYEEQKEQQVYLEKSEDSIIDMLHSIDERKEACLDASFVKVDKQFHRIFSSVVPNGSAKLSRVKKPQSEVEAGDKRTVTDENIQPEGICIKVSFTGKSSSFYRMEQLSGGQRTIVAVSLIFALQSAEAAPIYILDEIDAALDDEYRHAIGRIMNESCSKSQFIMTTFRKQLAEFGRHFIKVGLVDRKSEHRVVNKQEALEAISEAERDEVE
eukprot:GHVH01017362.1.p1 GENE.GHVH01017362.1~~GHVH01017362.1.p1  ORF type:complete len:1235 (+),score=253.80 GHVH01017362.1:208-3912(+)